MQDPTLSPGRIIPGLYPVRERPDAKGLPSAQMSNQHHPWWHKAVFYQIYPLSFADSDGDGFGDLQGIIDRLDYLSGTLGVDALWLSPFFKSPMKDWGYDVADYTDVDPRFGTLADAERLIEEVHERGMRLIIDYVPNHSSDQHEWFQESRSSLDNPKRDWYVWRDPKPDGSPPNNWLAVFGGPAWTLDDTTGQYYRHTFLAEQPDLNWRNEEVVTAMLDVIRFWLDRGVDGLRVDVAHHILKDPLERDNPPTPAEYVNPLKPMADYDSQQHLSDVGHEDVHEIHRRMRAVLDEYDHEPTSVTEIHEWDLKKWASYYGEGLNELHMPFNFHLMVADWNATAIRRTVESVLEALPKGGWTNWTLGNHDEQRLASRLGENQARLAALLLLTLPGTPFIYYGDELGMVNGPTGGTSAKDPWARAGQALSRDVCRTPMQWHPGEHGGFTTGEPWLAVCPGHGERNVASDLDDESSMLTLYRRLLRLRNTTPDLHLGDYATHPISSDEVFAYRRGDHLIVLNFTDRAIEFPISDGTVELSTHSGWGGDPERVSGRLLPHEGIVLSAVGRTGIIDYVSPEQV